MSFFTRKFVFAAKLPFAIAWDCLTGCNLGERSETEQVFKSYRRGCMSDWIEEHSDEIAVAIAQELLEERKKENATNQRS